MEDESQQFRISDQNLNENIEFQQQHNQIDNINKQFYPQQHQKIQNVCKNQQSNISQQLLMIQQTQQRIKSLSYEEFPKELLSFFTILERSVQNNEQIRRVFIQINQFIKQKTEYFTTLGPYSYLIEKLIGILNQHFKNNKGDQDYFKGFIHLSNTILSIDKGYSYIFLKNNPQLLSQISGYYLRNYPTSEQKKMIQISGQLAQINGQKSGVYKDCEILYQNDCQQYQQIQNAQQFKEGVKISNNQQQNQQLIKQQQEYNQNNQIEEDDEEDDEEIFLLKNNQSNDNVNQENNQIQFLGLINKKIKKQKKNCPYKQLNPQQQQKQQQQQQLQFQKQQLYYSGKVEQDLMNEYSLLAFLAQMSHYIMKSEDENIKKIRLTLMEEKFVVKILNYDINEIQDPKRRGDFAKILSFLLMYFIRHKEQLQNFGVMDQLRTFLLVQISQNEEVKILCSYLSCLHVICDPKNINEFKQQLIQKLKIIQKIMICLNPNCHHNLVLYTIKLLKCFLQLNISRMDMLKLGVVEKMFSVFRIQPRFVSQFFEELIQKTSKKRIVMKENFHQFKKFVYEQIVDKTLKKDEQRYLIRIIRDGVKDLPEQETFELLSQGLLKKLWDYYLVKDLRFKLIVLEIIYTCINNTKKIKVNNLPYVLAWLEAFNFDNILIQNYKQIQNMNNNLIVINEQKKLSEILKNLVNLYYADRLQGNQQKSYNKIYQSISWQSVSEKEKKTAQQNMREKNLEDQFIKILDEMYNNKNDGQFTQEQVQDEQQNIKNENENNNNQDIQSQNTQFKKQQGINNKNIKRKNQLHQQQQIKHQLQYKEDNELIEESKNVDNLDNISENSNNDDQLNQDLEEVQQEDQDDNNDLYYNELFVYDQGNEKQGKNQQQQKTRQNQKQQQQLQLQSNFQLSLQLSSSSSSQSGSQSNIPIMETIEIDVNDDISIEYSNSEKKKVLVSMYKLNIE